MGYPMWPPEFLREETEAVRRFERERPGFVSATDLRPVQAPGLRKIAEARRKAADARFAQLARSVNGDFWATRWSPRGGQPLRREKLQHAAAAVAPPQRVSPEAPAPSKQNSARLPERVKVRACAAVRLAPRPLSPAWIPSGTEECRPPPSHHLRRRRPIPAGEAHTSGEREGFGAARSAANEPASTGQSAAVEETSSRTDTACSTATVGSVDAPQVDGLVAPGILPRPGASAWPRDSVAARQPLDSPPPWHASDASDIDLSLAISGDLSGLSLWHAPQGSPTTPGEPANSALDSFRSDLPPWQNRVESPEHRELLHQAQVRLPCELAATRRLEDEAQQHRSHCVLQRALLDRGENQRSEEQRLREGEELRDPRTLEQQHLQRRFRPQRPFARVAAVPSARCDSGSAIRWLCAPCGAIEAVGPLTLDAENELCVTDAAECTSASQSVEGTPRRRDRGSFTDTWEIRSPGSSARREASNVAACGSSTAASSGHFISSKSGTSACMTGRTLSGEISADSSRFVTGASGAHSFKSIASSRREATNTGTMTVGSTVSIASGAFFYNEQKPCRMTGERGSPPQWDNLVPVASRAVRRALRLKRRTRAAARGPQRFPKKKHTLIDLCGCIQITASAAPALSPTPDAISAGTNPGSSTGSSVVTTTGNQRQTSSSNTAFLTAKETYRSKRSNGLLSATMSSSHTGDTGFPAFPIEREAPLSPHTDISRSGLMHMDLYRPPLARSGRLSYEISDEHQNALATTGNPILSASIRPPNIPIATRSIQPFSTMSGQLYPHRSGGWSHYTDHPIFSIINTTMLSVGAALNATESRSVESSVESESLGSGSAESGDVESRSEENRREESAIEESGGSFAATACTIQQFPTNSSATFYTTRDLSCFPECQDSVPATSQEDEDLPPATGGSSLIVATGNPAISSVPSTSPHFDEWTRPFPAAILGNEQLAASCVTARGTTTHTVTDRTPFPSTKGTASFATTSGNSTFSTTDVQNTFFTMERSLRASPPQIIAPIYLIRLGSRLTATADGWAESFTASCTSATTAPSVTSGTMSRTSAASGCNSYSLTSESCYSFESRSQLPAGLPCRGVPLRSRICRRRFARSISSRPTSSDDQAAASEQRLWPAVARLFCGF